MKKTYLACLVFGFSSLFYYTELTGKGASQCTRGRFTALNNNPSTCTQSGCHVGGVVSTDSLSTATGIDEVSFSEGIAAFPTLTSYFLNIETKAASPYLTYNVYSMDGRAVMTGSLPSYPALTFVDLHTLAPAGYVVRVSDGAHGATFRIVKQ